MEFYSLLILINKTVEILEKIRAMKDDPIHVKFDESNPTVKKRWKHD